VLQRAVERAAEDPFFLGAALAEYRAGEGLDAAGLAARLGGTLEALPRLALCRRPDPADPGFAGAVRRIASWAGVDADALANVVRYAESVAALRRIPARRGHAGSLLAARDRDEAAPAPAGAEPPVRDAGGTQGTRGAGETESGGGDVTEDTRKGKYGTGETGETESGVPDA
jgi:hypothetical protein